MQLHFFRWTPRVNKHDFPLVFLHGMGGTGRIWRPIAAQLEDEFDCIAPDQRGHGESRPVSSDEANAFRAQDYAKDVSELLDRLNVNPCVLVGHSMGVRTALGLAALAPSRIKGLIAVDIGITSAWGGGIGKPLADFMENLPVTFPNRTLMREYLFAHCPDPAIAQYLSAVAMKVSEEPEMWKFPFDHQALVKTIHAANEAPIEKWLTEILDAGVQVLFLRGEKSKVWLKPDYEAQRLRFHHPLLTFEEWENCGHGLPFEQRTRFIERIRAFVASIE